MSSSEGSGSVRGEAGFSLLEVIISLVVLLTVLVSVSSLLVTAFKVGANSRYRQDATEIATSALDNAIQTGSTTLLGQVGDTALATVTSAGQQYIGELEVSPYTPGTVACASPSGGLAMLKVTVWETWADVTAGSLWWVPGNSASTGLLVEETTLLALPPSAFNASDGTILVDVNGAAGNGVQGVTVTATQGGTTLSAVTTAAGCALFANVATGTWNISASRAGYIDSADDWSNNAALPATGSASVSAGNVATTSLLYDAEATVTPTYTVTLAGGTPWLPTGINSTPLTFFSSESGFPSTGYVAASPGLVYPYLINNGTTPSYYVVAGSCGSESSPAGNSLAGAQTDGQPVTLTSGSQASPTFALTPLDLVVSHQGTAVTNAQISASVSGSDANCQTGSLAMPTLNLGTTCVPGGTGPTSCSVLAAHRRTVHGRRHPAHAVFTSTCNSSCATTTSVTSGTNPTTYGSTTTLLTATVACSPNACSGGLGQPTGTVTFYSNGTSIGTGTLNGSSPDKATYTTTVNRLASGLDSITAKYAGVANKWLTSTSSAITQTVDAPTTTVLSSNPNPNSYGTSTILTANVTAAGTAANATGTVTFKNGAATICSNATVNSGQATCTASGLAGGSYTLQAFYTASSYFLSSTSATYGQTVSPASTATSVTSSSFLNASPAGTQVTFTATVTSSAGTPGGTAAFSSNGTAIAGCTAVTLSSGSAQCQTSSLAVGNDTISVTFTPSVSTNFASSSGSMVQLVYAESQTPVIESGLPYGSWILTVTYAPGGAGSPFIQTYTVLINTAGVYVNGVKASSSLIQLLD